LHEDAEQAKGVTEQLKFGFLGLKKKISLEHLWHPSFLQDTWFKTVQAGCHAAAGIST